MFLSDIKNMKKIKHFLVLDIYYMFKLSVEVAMY